MATNIHLLHKILPPLRNGLMLVPFGFYANKHLLEAKRGDVIVFHEGWREDKVTLRRMCKIKYNSSAYNFLAQSVHKMNPTEMFKLWKSQYLLQGEVIDNKECLLIEYEINEE